MGFGPVYRYIYFNSQDKYVKKMCEWVVQYCNNLMLTLTLENQQSQQNDDAYCHGRKKHFQWWRDKLISLDFLNQKISREWHEQGARVQCSTCVLYSVYCTGVQVYRMEECAHVKLWKPLGRLSWCETRVTIASQRHRDVLSCDEDVSHNCQGLFMSWRKIYLDK